MGYTPENTVLPNEAGGIASVWLSYLPTVLAEVVVFFSAALIFITIDKLSLVRRVVWQGKKIEKVKGRRDEGRKRHFGVMLR